MKKQTWLPLLALAGGLGGWVAEAAEGEAQSLGMAKALFEKAAKKAFTWRSRTVLDDADHEQANIPDRPGEPHSRPKYKELIRQPCSGEEVNDTNRYQTAPIGPSRKVEIMPCFERKKHTFPIRLVVGLATTGKWLIYEEHPSPG
jgi:hypothetical protein